MKLWYLNEDTTNGLRYVITVDYMNNRWVDRAKWKAFQNRLGLFYNGGVQIVNLTQFSLWPTFTLAFCWLGCFSKPLIDCFAGLRLSLTLSARWNGESATAISTAMDSRCSAIHRGAPNSSSCPRFGTLNFSTSISFLLYLVLDLWFSLPFNYDRSIGYTD